MNAVEFGELLKKNEDKFIDLGLDSGTLWGGNDIIIYRNSLILNLDCPFYEHIKNLGYQLPTKEQFDELFNSCFCKLYNKGGRDFVVVKSKVNNNFLRFYITGSFLLRNTTSNLTLTDTINIKSTYFPKPVEFMRKTPSSFLFFMDIITYDLIFVKDK